MKKALRVTVPRDPQAAEEGTSHLETPRKAGEHRLYFSG